MSVNSLNIFIFVFCSYFEYFTIIFIYYLDYFYINRNVSYNN